MKGIRETRFISSAANSESREYRLIVRLTPELRTAIQDDLQDISDHLLSFGMITQDNYEDFTNDYKPTHTRAASLIRTVQNKIKLDCHSFWKFVEILEKNKRYYSSVLQKLYSDDIDSPPMYSQHHVCEDSLSESDETGALLHGHVPYVQYEDDSQCRKPKRQYYSLCSNIVSIFYSSCIKRFMVFVFGNPLRYILVVLMANFLFIIMMYYAYGILDKLNFNLTAVLVPVYVFFFGFILTMALYCTLMCILFCCVEICYVWQSKLP